MRSFRILHLAVLLFLGAVIAVAVASIITVIIPTQKTPQVSRKHLRDLLAPPTTQTLFPELSSPQMTILRYGKISASTPSATLLRAVTPDEALFLNVFRPSMIESQSFLSFSSRKLQLTWDEERVRRFVASLSATIDTHTQFPSVSYSPGTSPPFSIFPGKAGQGLDEEKAVQTIIRSSSLSTEVLAESRSVNPPLTETQIQEAKNRITKLIPRSLVFTAAGRSFTLASKDIARFISLPTGFEHQKIRELVLAWAKAFNLETVEPQLAFDGQKITTFRAPVEGRIMEVEKNTELILAALAALEETGDETTKELVITLKRPKISLDSLNGLGITERLGRGDSEYAHSIPNRIYNVSLATSRIHGKIIEPGEVFSFNKTVGEISAATGYKQAYVIERGQTILGDGGGVCQVSSTLFRALLDAGLPILARRGHSYRVGYYEQNSKPGFDATVSAPYPDLTFLNDTGVPILINAQADSKTVRMYIELYGKNDGRKAEILNYKQWANSPAPPPLYQDDPTLPSGVIKQVDFAAGGLKTSFEYRVRYPDGNVKSTTYLTSYTPWRAVYLRGTRQ